LEQNGSRAVFAGGEGQLGFDPILKMADPLDEVENVTGG